MQTAIRRAVYNVTNARKRNCAKIEALAQEPQEDARLPPEDPMINGDQHRWSILLVDPKNREILLRNLAKITEKQRKAVELVMIDRMSLSHAARFLGVSDGVLRDRIARAIASARRSEGIGQSKHLDDLQRMQAAVLAGRGKRAVHVGSVVILSGGGECGRRGDDAGLGRTQRGSVQLREL